MQTELELAAQATEIETGDDLPILGPYLLNAERFHKLQSEESEAI